VLVQEVNTVGPQALQHVIHHDLDVVGPAIQARESLPGFLVDVPAKLRLNHDFVAEGAHRFAEDTLYLPRAIRLRGIE
jgi:hypothetical protein